MLKFTNSKHCAGRHRDLVNSVAHRMAKLRQRREVGNMDKVMPGVGGYCTVKNMTCSEFPMKSKCRLISIKYRAFR